MDINTLKEIIADDEYGLLDRDLKDFCNRNYDRDTMIDIVEYGAQKGYNGITYRNDILDLYYKHMLQIDEMIHEYQLDIGKSIFKYSEYKSYKECVEMKVWICIELICELIIHEQNLKELNG